MRKTRAMRMLVAAAMVGGMLALSPGVASADYYAALSGGPVAVNGTYIPVVGNFTGDAREEIFWYAPGSGPEALWSASGSPAAPFIKQPSRSISGTYQPLVGNFSGDAYDEIFWYGPGTQPDSLWDNPSGGEFVPRAVSVNGTYEPFTLDVGAGWTSIFWYAPGPGIDWVWTFTNTSWVAKSTTVTGRYTPVVGDYTADGVDDVFWYAPGETGDALWIRYNEVGFYRSSQSVNGTYRPVVGEWSATADGVDDILWLNPSGSDPLFEGNGVDGFSSFRVNVPNRKALLADSPGKDLLLLWGGTAADQVWLRDAGGAEVLAPRGGPKAPDPSIAFSGTFVNTSFASAFFYRPGTASELLLF